MKKYIIVIICFFVTVAIFDYGFGYIGDYLIHHAKSGDYEDINTACNIQTADVIILGSSRAKHHYIPDVIEDSLEMSCFNGGMDAVGIIYEYGRYLLMTQRYTPKIVIYEVNPSSDISIEKDHAASLGELRPYANISEIKEYISSFDKKEDIKLLSNFYRYNSKILKLLKGQAEGEHVKKGYVPMNRVMNYDPKSLVEFSTVDSIKLNLFEKLFLETKKKNIKLYLAASPKYGMKSDSIMAPIKLFCIKHKIPFINHYSDTNFVHNKELFADQLHLNNTGARLYSSIIAKELRKNEH